MRRCAGSHGGREWTGGRVLLGLGIFTFAACARLLGVDDVGVRQSGAAGAATGGNEQSAGTAGLYAKGGSGGGAGHAGKLNRAAGAGGVGTNGGAGAAHGGTKGIVESGAGGAANGAAPSKTGGTGGSGGSSGALVDEMGGAGAGGEAGAPLDGVVNGVATGGTPCSVIPYACSDVSPLVVLSCYNGQWRYYETCDLDQRCDRTVMKASYSSDMPLCKLLDPTCYAAAPNGPVCQGNTAFDCGPTVYVAQKHVCPFGCSDGACELGTAEDLTLHTGADDEFPFWDPQEPIPVCLRTTAKNAARDTELFGWVRSEVESDFNRFFAPEFVDWDTCNKKSSGVALSFADDCSWYLVNDIVRPVASGAPIEMTLCATYLDPTGDKHALTKNESLARLLARHQFGHVFGLDDPANTVPTGMQRGVLSGHEDDLVLTAEDYGVLFQVPIVYPQWRHKAGPALVTPSGACLTASGAGAATGTVVATPCSAVNAQMWLAAYGSLQNTADGTNCLQAGNPGDPVIGATCSPGDPAQTFQPAHVQWRTPTTCVVPEQQPPTAGTALTTATCGVAGDLSQAWFFEVVGSHGNYTLARIHFADSHLCVTVPLPSPPPLIVPEFDELELFDCTSSTAVDDPQIFELLGDGITNNLFDVTWQDPVGTLLLEPPNSLAVFFLTGALEAPDGTALTLLPDSTLTTAPLGTQPASNQIFDVHY